VRGADVSTAQTQKDWAAAFVSQSGKLEEANMKQPYIRSVLSACEKREREIYDSLNGKKRRFFGLF
jgi:hypothetical protein